MMQKKQQLKKTLKIVYINWNKAEIKYKCKMTNLNEN